MTARTKVAIAGLGKAGSRFDENAKWGVVFSHAGAYLARADRFEIAGGADPDEGNSAAFARRCPQAKLFTNAREMCAALQPDVVSVCTPLGRHAADIADILEVSHPKIIWCEKPLAADLASARALVALAEEKGVRLAVTYNRRYLSFWRRVRALIEDGAIGRPAGVRVAMPNRLLSIGSHAADLLLYLAGSRPQRIAPLAIPALEQDGEPAVAASIRFESGVYGLIQVTGFKAQKIVEAEAWGDGGRIRADELSGEIEVRQFEASPHEPDYRNLGDPRIERPKGWRDESAFVAVLDEIAAMLDGTRARATSDGLSALDAQEVVEVMAAAASEGHGT